MYRTHGFIRVGAIVPKLKVANVPFNTDEIISELKKAQADNIQIITTPELSLTGYTCADLFHQDILIEESQKGLKKILDYTKKINMVVIIGMPLRHENQLFNCAVVLQKGNILGAIPKTYLPNYSEFYERRWFSSSISLRNKTINLLNQDVPFDTNILFEDKDDNHISFGIEICEDLWSIYPPSNRHAANGATIIFNLSASNEIIGKYEYRKELVKSQSARLISAYVYASSGVNESSTDLVFSGHAMLTENGSILKENKRFDFNSNYIYADIDIQRLVNDRCKNKSYMNIMPDEPYLKVKIDLKDNLTALDRSYNQYPFVPEEEEKRKQQCEEIFNIQACGLAKRLMHTKTQKTVIGISGGLDSTLAFLVIIKAYEKLGIDNKNIIAVTMPGFGTTNRTYDNAIKLIKAYGATLKEVNIKAACEQHFKDIDISIKNKNIAFENSQARERTQILMDIANKENGLVIGTGDLSELALGWCTYNGDHMSMYGVNNSIPKTLVKYLVKWVADNETKKRQIIINDILDTPISPELLPPDKDGNIAQQTENVVGPYVLHDFYLYHFLRYGATPEKIYLLAKQTFKNEFTNEVIKKWLITFIKRFFAQQFKRSCLPDGPKVGSISLSPRGDLRMPSDADMTIWLDSIEKM